MHLLRDILSESIVEAFGWALFHSVWQIALISCILYVFLLLLKRKSSNSRYLVSVMALCTIVILSGLTFTKNYRYAKEKQALKEIIVENPNYIKNIIQSNELGVQSLSENKRNNGLLKAQFRGFMQRHYHKIFIIWLLGILVLFFRMAGGLLFIRRLKTRGTQHLPDSILDKFTQFSNQLGITRPIKVFQSALTKTPVVVGYLKPIILVPIQLVTGLSEKEIEAIIAHEMAHIKRHDYFVNIIQSVIEVLFFYHPAAWYISRTIRSERESACDEIALTLTNDKVSYLKALTNSQILSNHKYNSLQMAFSGTKGSLLKRAINIQKLNTMKKNVTEGFIAATIVFFSLILVSFSIDGHNLKNEAQTDSPIRLKEKSSITATQTSTSALVSNDSIKKVRIKKIEELEDVPEEIETLMELAYTNNHNELSDLITESISLAMIEVDISEILHEVDSAIHAANINSEISEALIEARIELDSELKNDSIIIAIEALDMAHKTIEAIDIENIVSVALEQAAVAMESIDFEHIMEDAIIEASEALKDIDIEQIMEDAMDVENDIHYEHNYEDFEKEFRESMSESSSKSEQSSQRSTKQSSASNSDKQKTEELEQKLREIED